MKYRAILVDPGNVNQERPIQLLTNSPSDVDDWAEKQLAKAIADNAAVNVYALEERHLKMLTKKGKPK